MHVGIIGVGLIGGSFGLALRKAEFTGAILGVSSARSIDQAVERGAIDRGATLEEAAAVCDLLFLSQPISGILETLRKLDPLVRPDALVTDAGSTKQAIADEGVAISLVPDADIRTALKDLFEAQAVVVEPSSAITLAFVKARVEQLEEPICVILTGENIARDDHRRLI